jgi:hypothetical protein
MRRRVALGLAAALTALGAGAAVAIALSGTSSPVVTATACRSALMPAYLPADGLARIAQRPMAGRIVIMNPANGPGAEARPDYRTAVSALQSGGTRVLGYVHTGYGARDPAAVLADATRYRSWYGVDGVFLDETPDAEAALPYYRSIAEQARADGLRLVALNPGTVPARGYFDIADIVVTFEGPATTYDAALRETPPWVAEAAGGKVAQLLYGATRAEALAAATQPGAGYLYATAGTLPDPWSALPPYLDEFETALAACR